MRILQASDRALLVEATDLAEAMRMNRAWEQVPGIIERIPAARTVLVRFDPAQVSAASLAAALEATGTDAAHKSTKHEVVIPVHYDGEDLAEVAALLGVSPEELVTRHLAAHWEVAFSGFAPGFGYLVGDDPLFQVPRRSSPRTRVPAGAVALAGEFTGVYPRESPGGWQLIGRTDAVMWDINRDPPALLAPGAAVRFARARRDSAAVVAVPGRREVPDHPAVDRRAGAIEVVQTSLQLLVQDAGRPGHAALGVSASGAADRRALRDANRAVGNEPGSAVVESVGGVVLRFRGAGVAVVTGAIGALSLVDAVGPRTAVHGVPFATADGDELTLGHPTNGLRYTIGVRGGVDVASALGSRASDTLAGLGPAALLSGDSIPIGSTRRGVVEPIAAERMLPAPGDLVELQITLGPRDDWFTAKARATLTEQEWLVTSRSDRVGMRLQGDVPLERSILSELPSEGAVTGVIQVPPDGQPVLFLPDHPLTGGYPIIGAVTDRCLDLAGQLPPGVRIRFRV
ncbi:carboxyltransferase domain-containing protein [Microbacterium sp. A82]|uniref:5-oxoprolinase subunit B/C family protein n=1 Tax=Microbacterium sp. A82 TaxID=3450452 RepID=UPI003F2B89DE